MGLLCFPFFFSVDYFYDMYQWNIFQNTTFRYGQDNDQMFIHVINTDREIFKKKGLKCVHGLQRAWREGERQGDKFKVNKRPLDLRVLYIAVGVQPLTVGFSVL